MRTKYVLAVIIVISLFACQKDPDGSILSPANCTLEKVVYFDTDGTPEDTVKLSYSGSQITRADYSDVAITLEYTNGKVSKRNILLQGTTAVVYYDQFTYNTDGTVSKVESFVNTVGNTFQYYSYEYTYSSGKIATILEKQDTASTGAGGGALVPVYNYIFTYTGNNITKVEEQDLIDNVSGTYTYKYDTKPNYFNKIPNSYFFEIEFLDLFTPNLPLLLSENNVTDYDDSSGETDLTYTEENGNIKTFLVDGSKVATYMYKCQ